MIASAPSVWGIALPLAEGAVERAGILVTQETRHVVDLQRLVHEQLTAKFASGFGEEIAECRSIVGDASLQGALACPQVTSDAGDLGPPAREAPLQDDLDLIADRAVRAEVAERCFQRWCEDFEDLCIVTGKRAIEVGRISVPVSRERHRSSPGSRRSIDARRSPIRDVRSRRGPVREVGRSPFDPRRRGNRS